MWASRVEQQLTLGSASSDEPSTAADDLLDLLAAHGGPRRGAAGVGSTAPVERDASAWALFHQLESASAELDQALADLPGGSAGALLLADAAAAASAGRSGGGSELTRGDHGMYSVTASDQRLLDLAVRARREESKAARAALKAERAAGREARLRAQRRAEARAARRARLGAATGATEGGAASTANRGGAAGPGPSSAGLGAEAAAPPAPEQTASRTAAPDGGEGAAAAARAPEHDPPSGPTPPPEPLLPSPAAPPSRRSLLSGRRSSEPAVAAHEPPSRAAGAASSGGETTSGRRGAAGGAMGSYVREASLSDLLTSDQEAALCALARGGAAAAAIAPPAGPAAAHAAAAAAAAASAARRMLVAANLRLVLSVARQHQGRGVALADLVSEGVAGLLRGAEGFDSSKGLRLATYAHWWIRQGVGRAVMTQARLVRLPDNMFVLHQRARRAAAKLAAELRRPPAAGRVAAALGVEARRLRELADALMSVRSLEGTVGGAPDGAKLADTLESSAPWAAGGAGAAAAAAAALRADVDSLLASLGCREAVVLRLRFGIGCEPLTRPEVGAALKVTKERVRQLEARALRALRLRAGELGADMEHHCSNIGESEGGGGGAQLPPRAAGGDKRAC